MNPEPDLTCPNCGGAMEVLAANDHSLPSNYMRVCPVCATLAWNSEDGRVETRTPQKVEGKELEELTRNRKFVSAEDERKKN